MVKIAPLTRERDPITKEFKNPENIKDLTPEGLRMIVAACEANDIDGITATNTAQEHDFVNETKILRPDGVTITGGMSGKELFPTSLNTVRELRENTKLPVIGVGGLGYGSDEEFGKDLLEMEQAGGDVSGILSSFVQ